MQSNGGSNIFTNIAPLKLLPLEVHYNEDYMANILSLKDVSSLPDVRHTMDSSKERAIIVNFDDILVKFQDCRERIYYHDTAATNEPETYTTPYFLGGTVKVKHSTSLQRKFKGWIEREGYNNKLAGPVPHISNSSYPNNNN